MKITFKKPKKKGAKNWKRFKNFIIQPTFILGCIILVMIAVSGYAIYICKPFNDYISQLLYKNKLSNSYELESNSNIHYAGVTENVVVKANPDNLLDYAATIRLGVTNANVVSFTPADGLIAIGTCSNGEMTTNNSVCVDLAKSSPFEYGEDIGVMSITWGFSGDTVITTMAENGYYDGTEYKKIIVDPFIVAVIKGLPLTGTDTYKSSDLGKLSKINCPVEMGLSKYSCSANQTLNCATSTIFNQAGGVFPDVAVKCHNFYSDPECYVCGSCTTAGVDAVTCTTYNNKTNCTSYTKYDLNSCSNTACPKGLNCLTKSLINASYTKCVSQTDTNDQVMDCCASGQVINDGACVAQANDCSDYKEYTKHSCTNTECPTSLNCSPKHLTNAAYTKCVSRTNNNSDQILDCCASGVAINSGVCGGAATTTPTETSTDTTNVDWDCSKSSYNSHQYKTCSNGDLYWCDGDGSKHTEDCGSLSCVKESSGTDDHCGTETSTDSGTTSGGTTTDSGTTSGGTTTSDTTSGGTTSSTGSTSSGSTETVSGSGKYSCGQKGCKSDSECGSGLPKYECDETTKDWPNNNVCVVICSDNQTRVDSCTCKSKDDYVACGNIDTNGDGILNYIDLSEFAKVYNKSCSDKPATTGCGGKDTNSDGIVNYIDLQNFSKRYHTVASSCAI